MCAEIDSDLDFYFFFFFFCTWTSIDLDLEDQYSLSSTDLDRQHWSWTYVDLDRRWDKRLMYNLVQLMTDPTLALHPMISDRLPGPPVLLCGALEGKCAQVNPKEKGKCTQVNNHSARTGRASARRSNVHTHLRHFLFVEVGFLYHCWGGGDKCTEVKWLQNLVFARRMPFEAKQCCGLTLDAKRQNCCDSKWLQMSKHSDCWAHFAP